MTKKKEEPIYFNKPIGRLHADALDTYYWLLLHDKKLAKVFWLKAKGAEKKLDKSRTISDKKDREARATLRNSLEDMDKKETLQEKIKESKRWSFTFPKRFFSNPFKSRFNFTPEVNDNKKSNKSRNTEKKETKKTKTTKKK